MAAASAPRALTTSREVITWGRALWAGVGEIWNDRHGRTTKPPEGGAACRRIEQWPESRSLRGDRGPVAMALDGAGAALRVADTVAATGAVGSVEPTVGSNRTSTRAAIDAMHSHNVVWSESGIRRADRVRSHAGRLAWVDDRAVPLGAGSASSRHGGIRDETSSTARRGWS
jgi:hypothetical protein